MRRHRSKAGARIQPESWSKTLVGFEMDSFCPHLSGGIDGGFNQLTADTAALMVFAHSHFAQLVLVGRVRDQRAAANRKPIDYGEKNGSALAKDRSFGIAQNLMVLGLEHKVAANPCPVQGLKSGLIPLLVRPHEDGCFLLRVLLGIHVRSMVPSHKPVRFTQS
jgi:hypothetical protein